MEQKMVQELEQLFRDRGLDDFKWLVPSRDIIVAQWVRMKCMFGCGEYGRCAVCPPNTPSIPECAKFFGEYRQGVVFHFTKKVKRPGDRRQWSKGVNENLAQLEREVFLRGHEKAFVLFMDSCGLCKECAGSRDRCRNPGTARPGLDAMGIDVYSTVRGIGYKVEVLTDHKEEMNRYALLLIE